MSAAHNFTHAMKSDDCIRTLIEIGGWISPKTVLNWRWRVNAIASQPKCCILTQF